MPSSVQSLSHVQLFASPQTAACQASLSITNSQGLLKLMSTASCPLHQWCHPTISSSVVPFSSCPQSFLTSGSFPMSQLFTSGGQSIGVSASTSVLPMNMQDWLDLLSVQGILKSLLHHHSSKASVLWCSTILMIQFSHPYMTTGKTTALTRWTFVGKGMSLLFNMLSAAAAKSLQSCPTLCNPIDGSPPGLPIPGILQARTLEWGAIAFSASSPNQFLNVLNSLTSGLVSGLLFQSTVYLLPVFRY